MEEIEVPTEHLHEEIQERAEERKEKWILGVALSTAFMAVLAAVAGLLAGHHANEAMIARVEASDQWNYYQAKTLKIEISANTDKILHTINPATAGVADNSADIARRTKEKEDIQKKAEDFEKESEAHLSKHVPLATAVTAFQIAIAISAIAILTKRKKLWFAGLVLTLGGIYFLILGILP
jgi:hypothetical protein